MFKSNTEYKILSPKGFVNFSGIQKVYKPFYHYIIFDDGGEIKCSNKHPFGKNKIIAEKLKVNDLLDGRRIVYNEIVEEGIWLYDPIDVDDGSLYYSNDVISHNCDFLGSSYTLISASVLTNTPKRTPLISNEGLDILTEVEDGHTYVITVDVAEGVGQNFSAFVVIDITEQTHYVVAKYRNNTVDIFVFPDVIHEVAKNYNNAFVLCETNVGGQVGRTLQYDLDYPNLLMSMPMGRTGFILGQGFSEKTAEYGVKMSKKTKREGCRNLKTVMETHKLLVYDYDIIQELSTFIQKRGSYQADDGCNDDLCMSLVLYGWMVTQDYFKELTDQDIRKKISEENKDKLEGDLMPFGFISDGLNDESSIVDDEGDRWFLDEYGDVSTEMGYLHHYN